MWNILDHVVTQSSLSVAVHAKMPASTFTFESLIIPFAMARLPREVFSFSVDILSLPRPSSSFPQAKFHSSYILGLLFAETPTLYSFLRLHATTIFEHSLKSLFYHRWWGWHHFREVFFSPKKKKSSRMSEEDKAIHRKKWQQEVRLVFFFCVLPMIVLLRCLMSCLMMRSDPRGIKDDTTNTQVLRVCSRILLVPLFEETRGEQAEVFHEGLCSSSYPFLTCNITWQQHTSQTWKHEKTTKCEAS